VVQTIAGAIVHIPTCMEQVPTGARLPSELQKISWFQTKGRRYSCWLCGQFIWYERRSVASGRLSHTAEL